VARVDSLKPKAQGFELSERGGSGELERLELRLQKGNRDLVLSEGEKLSMWNLHAIIFAGSAVLPSHLYLLEQWDLRKF